jgi:hypothetical protein
MTFVRSFQGFKPPERYDDEPFTTIRLEEAAGREGPWAEIDVFSLEPVDDDPASPTARSFTTVEAVEDPGWYRIVWEDADANTFTSDPLRYGGGIASVQDVLDAMHLDSVSTTEAGRIMRALESAEVWARERLRQPNLGVIGTTVVDSYWNQTFIPYSGTLVEVRVTPFPGADTTVVPATSYEADGRRIRIYSRGWAWPGLPADEQVWPGNHRIDVVTQQDGYVDPRVRDAIALYAASLWHRMPSAAKGLQSESLGDYSYTLAGGGSNATATTFADEAKELLPAPRRGPLVV